MRNIWAPIFFKVYTVIRPYCSVLWGCQILSYPTSISIDIFVQTGYKGLHFFTLRILAIIYYTVRLYDVVGF